MSKNKSQKVRTQKEKISILFRPEEGFVLPAKHQMNFNYIVVCPNCHTPNVSNELESFYNNRTDFVTTCPICGERQRLSRARLIYFSSLKTKLIKIAVGTAISLVGIYALDQLAAYVTEFLM